MRYECDRKFSDLIATIRAQPGFDNFLLPLTETELKDAACFGPIVTINISPYRCDAFIVEHHRIQVLKLTGLKLKDVQEHAQNPRSSSPVAIVSTLEWLWDVVCSPILDALDFKNPVSDNNWPHIWWVPTGLLGQFPLHAAGYHEQNSTNTVLDRIVSSYALLVKALMHGRQHHVRSSAGSGIDQALLVAMKETSELSSNRILPFVEREVKVLEELYSSLQLKCVMPKLRKHDVLENSQECKVFYFVGHGSSYPTEPPQSYLLLEDWKTNPLTVGNVRNCGFQENPPFLGYLSACLTDTNEAEKLAAERVHLISAFQLAGFQHVIGTLWEVSNKYCVEVARIFYEALRSKGMAGQAVCRKLHRAVRVLRDGNIEKEGTKRKLKLLGVEEYMPNFSGSLTFTLAFRRSFRALINYVKPIPFHLWFEFSSLLGLQFIWH
ncbi:hypothetical protein TWF102_003308 [Orbilia oligospora]|uniref:CHAT domain-containing protein n=1 Tax=Orbilia oligospora TaxID=2813651 RepID=A0A7C8N2E0_ORBOL|nr:hypothetical protein TWF102_003308 [Orbilia oligospora]KAF3112299.1 hypothetical protein TWF706_010886 [Orbilia oligospora]